MKPIIIKDDFLTEADKNEIENIITSNYFPWFITEQRFRTTELSQLDKLKKSGFKKTSLIKESSQFVHMFLDNVTNKKSDYYRLITELLKKLNLNCDVFRAKVNYLSQTLSFKKNNFHTPHNDFEFNHKVVIYYVVDSDGDTLFFNKKGDIINRVKPKKGRCVIFDGNILHASQNPIKSTERIVININLNEKD